MHIVSGCSRPPRSRSLPAFPALLVSRFLVPIRNLMQLVAEGSDTDTEQLRGMRPVAIRFFQCIENVLLLYDIERNDFIRKSGSGGCWMNFGAYRLRCLRKHWPKDRLRNRLIRFAQDDGSFDHVLQFSHVSRPIVPLKDGQSLLC